MRWRLTAALLALAALAYLLLFATRQPFITDARSLPGDGAAGRLLAPDLLLEGRPAIGSEAAPLTIAIVLDFRNPESAAQYRERIPLLEEYAERGEARLYHKYYLPEEEYEREAGRYRYAALAACYDGEETAAFHQELFALDEEALAALAEREGVAECFERPPAWLREEMLETRLLRLLAPGLHIGIRGEDATILLGDPSETEINRTIREKQVILGI